jgi:hypothetical protein
MEIKQIMQDERAIHQLIDRDGGTVTAGDTVDEIVAYQENGEMALIVWFAGIKGGKVLYRYNSKYIDTVSYKETHDTKS